MFDQMEIIPPGEKVNAHPDGLKGFISIYSIQYEPILIEDRRLVTRRIYRELHRIVVY